MLQGLISLPKPKPVSLPLPLLHNRGSKGAALLELVIVMALLVLIMVALVSLVVLSLSTVQKSRLRARATAIAQDGIENIKAQRDADEFVNNWDGPTGFETRCQSEAQNWAYGSVTIPVDGLFTPTTICRPSSVGVEVIVTVVWEFGGKQYNIELRTEFGPRQEGIFR